MQSWSKFSLSINLLCKISFDLVVFVSLPIMMNFACFLKTWIFSWKCLHANMASGFLTSLRCLDALILKLNSDFSTHRIMHYSNWLVEYCVWFIGLLAFKDWWRNHLLATKCHIIYWTGGTFTFFFMMLLCFFTLLCSILFLLVSSFKFLLRLKAVSGSVWKTPLSFVFR